MEADLRLDLSQQLLPQSLQPLHIKSVRYDIPTQRRQLVEKIGSDRPMLDLRIVLIHDHIQFIFE